MNTTNEADRPRIERHDVSHGINKSLVSLGFGISLVTGSDIGASFSGLMYRELRDGSGPEADRLFGSMEGLQ
jgi:hypothetical protein